MGPSVIDRGARKRAKVCGDRSVHVSSPWRKRRRATRYERPSRTAWYASTTFLAVVSMAVIPRYRSPGWHERRGMSDLHDDGGCYEPVEDPPSRLVILLILFPQRSYLRFLLYSSHQLVPKSCCTCMADSWQRTGDPPSSSCTTTLQIQPGASSRPIRRTRLFILTSLRPLASGTPSCTL